MPCVRCARTLSEGATFCPHCGLPVAASSLPFISDRSRTQSHPISSTSDSKEAISAGYAGFVFQEFSVPQVPTFPAQPGVPAASPLLSLSGVSVAQKLGGRSTGYTVLSILLAITLIFVGLGIALYVIGSTGLLSARQTS